MGMHEYVDGNLLHAFAAFCLVECVCVYGFLNCSEMLLHDL